MTKRARRSAVLAVEQRAVDHAYSCLERSRRDAIELRGLDVAASTKDSIEIDHDWDEQLASLDLGGTSLVFMRADVDADGAHGTFYIGRRAVFDERRDPVVISWSSPASVRWRLTTEQQPGEVRLLRQIVCDRRTVKRYLDLHGTDIQALETQILGVTDATADPSVLPPAEAVPSEPTWSTRSSTNSTEHATVRCTTSLRRSSVSNFASSRSSRAAS